MISDNTPYTTPELEVRELGPLDPPVHNAKAKHSPPPETPLPVPPLRATAAAPLDASAKKTAQSTGASDSEQKLQQPASSPMLLSRKSTILNTAPRVPSTLRKVVDVGSTEAKAEDGDKASALGIQHAASSAIHNEQAASGRTPPQSTSSLPPLLSPRMSTPALRKNLNEPTIMNLVDRSNTDSSSLPHPHDFEGYPLRPRPRSLNTLSGMSCRLSIITVDQEYEEFSYKKNAQQPVRPSLVRGWIRRLGGKVKYSFGQFMASPSLILQGNRDMARGTAQMNLSRQRRRTGMYSASTNNLGQPLSRRNTSQTTRSASIGGRPFSRRSLRMSRKAKRNSYRRRSSSSTSGNISRTISVAEMAAAAESAAELELAETTASIFASRAMMASERAQTQAAATVAPLHSLRSSAETTETTETTESATTTTTADVSPADFGTGLPVNAFSNRFEGNTVTNSPTYGPSFAASSADITKTNGLVPAGDLQPNANRIDTSATAAAVS